MIEPLKGKEFIADSELAWEDLGGGLKRKIMAYDDNLMMVKVAFEKGGIGTLHSHFHTQMSYGIAPGRCILHSATRSTRCIMPFGRHAGRYFHSYAGGFYQYFKGITSTRWAFLHPVSVSFRFGSSVL
jgi:hypothetical protein